MMAAWLLDWNDRISGFPGVHVLQTREWAEVKQNYGWIPLPQTWYDQDGKLIAAASVLLRRIRIWPFTTPFGVLYVPRGPLLDWKDSDLRERVLGDLEELSRKVGGIFIKIDPEVCLGRGVPGEDDEELYSQGQAVAASIKRRGWLFSQDQIQYRNTVWLDLSCDEDAILQRMKPKTRYNIRLAERKGVTVRTAKDHELEKMYQLYSETSVRDGFIIRKADYYLYTWRKFIQAGMAEALVAEVEGQIVAGLVLFFTADHAWYLFGMSGSEHRELMPNHLLQWTAITRAKQRGCKEYDMWGAPDNFHESDPMWGVFRFKQGLGGRVIRTIGAWDKPTHAGMYTLYTKILPRILDSMRRRGREETRRQAGV
jgi:peptidoglycan pentaglycine glycine transferase (the first glycine)